MEVFISQILQVLSSPPLIKNLPSWEKLIQLTISVCPFIIFNCLILETFKLIYSSKCSNFECGCIRVVRNVEVEEQNDARNIPVQNNQV